MNITQLLVQNGRRWWINMGTYVSFFLSFWRPDSLNLSGPRSDGRWDTSSKGCPHSLGSRAWGRDTPTWEAVLQSYDESDAHPRHYIWWYYRRQQSKDSNSRSLISPFLKDLTYIADHLGAELPWRIWRTHLRQTEEPVSHTFGIPTIWNRGWFHRRGWAVDAQEGAGGAFSCTCNGDLR